jgi:hypothetical protein
MRHSLAISLKIYLGLMAYLAAVRLVLTLFPQVFRSPAQAAVFEWKFLAIWTASGLLGVLLADRTGFPPAWGDRGTNARRVWLPLVLGVALGVVAIITDLATGWTQVVADKMHLPSIHIDFPASALIYPGGAIIVEVIYRLLLIPLLLWLISGVILRGRQEERVFWVLAVLTSLLEPLSQDLREMLNGPSRLAFVCVFVEDYALNFGQAWLFRRLGFLSSVLLRVFFYLIWHVLWGLRAVTVV